jgi:hypothetical protein
MPPIMQAEEIASQRAALALAISKLSVRVLAVSADGGFGIRETAAVSPCYGSRDEVKRSG